MVGLPADHASARRRLVRHLGPGALAALLACASVHAEPVVPSRDDQVLERLPTRLGNAPRLSDAVSRDPAEAARRARAFLDEARDRGDPRYAGYALAALAPWARDSGAPADIVVLRATLAQYQHDFEGAKRELDALLVREPRNDQAWLTLATIARVQGRYAASDEACGRVSIRLYGAACLVENAALRGQFAEGRRTLAALLGLAGSADGRRWLWTTLAELEERAGRPDAAREAFDRAGTLGRDSYVVLDRADFLLASGDPAGARRLLDGEPRPFGDGVLLRLAIAARRTQAADATAIADDLRARFAAARERGEAVSVHGRELARFLDEVEGRPADAVAVARDNLRIQKEPADFLVMANAALHARDAAAMGEVAALARSIGLVDQRLAAVVAQGTR